MTALGDVFMALPHVDAILNHHCDDQVWIMTDPFFASLFINHPRLHVTVLDRRHFWGKHSPLSATSWARKKQFNAIYDLQGNRTSRRVVRCSVVRKERLLWVSAATLGQARSRRRRSEQRSASVGTASLLLCFRPRSYQNPSWLRSPMPLLHEDISGRQPMAHSWFGLRAVMV